MLDILHSYWPHILAVLSLVLGFGAAVHATMTKDEVRTALGWVGIIILSPILGAVIYAVIGINRIRRKSLSNQRHKMRNPASFHRDDYDVTAWNVRRRFGMHGAAMQRLGDYVSHHRLTRGNKVEILHGGDETYAAMLSAIRQAERSVLLETYIFDDDAVGGLFVEALTQAVSRGVRVRVLVDAVGARYSFPSIVRCLRQAGVTVATFNGNIITGLRLPYANLRTHRKILIVDGSVAFTGGMNIREGFSIALHGKQAYGDTHFRVEGPVVADLFHLATEDWRFAGGDELSQALWALAAPALPPDRGMAVRLVASGPASDTMEINQHMLTGAFSLATETIRIKTPYLLPDRELVSALVSAARRGVQVDIFVPDNNNLKLVDRAMWAQFDQLLRDQCRIWRVKGTFDHSKLIVIDDYWVYVGSSNIDPRSLRLNFEVDLEIMDKRFAQKIAAIIDTTRQKAQQVELEALQKRPFLRRLFDRIIWLGSPYL